MCNTFSESVRDIASLLTSLRVAGTHNTVMQEFISGYTQNQVKSHKNVLFSNINNHLLLTFHTSFAFTALSFLKLSL